MANLIRTSKSGSDWTPNDLLAYNIRVEYQDSQTFFGIANLPQPHVDNEVLIAPDAAATQNDDPYTLLRTMDLAMAVRPGEESAVDDFAVQLFKILSYTGRAVGRVARTRKDLPFWVCGEQRHAKTDVCIMDGSDILLLVQEDKRHMDGSDPEPQLIAEAIAAFYNNNDTRVRALGLPTLQNQVIPGITMKGTMPIFYKILITTELVRAVQLGEYPAHETVVYAHLPAVPRPARRYSEGMKPLDNRHVILSCYEAFKQFL
ncbi:hypothetical protein BC827DRAFT_1264446 [Russula dissimulans]|nr:hypothetical protein BC827DRAFT_1264446 [Russula dissimulans]